MIGLDRVRFLGAGLNRPECALAHVSGLFFAPDWTGPGGVAVIAPSGRVTRIPATGAPAPLRPNGIALEPGGAFLLAHLGAEEGGVWRLHPDGRAEQVVADLPPTNFVLRDGAGRLWITVSTRVIPRAADYRRAASTGFIALHAEGETRIVAEGLGYANECLLSPDGRTLWVNETFARRTTAFDVAADGGLSRRRTVAEYGAGVFPDGLALDELGGLWVTSIVSNRVLRVDPDGGVATMLEDADPAHLAWVEAAFAADEMDRPHLARAGGRRLRNISNLAFGGPGLATACLGCLLGDALALFDAPVRGAEPAHWRFDLGPLAALAED